MRPNLPQIARALAAAIVGAAWSLLLLAAALTVMVVILQAGLFWFESGSFELLPTATPASGAEVDVDIVGATPAEATAIREALASLRYRPAPGAVTFAVTAEPCESCGGEFVSGLNLIRMQQTVVDGDSLLLRRAVAHEIGHYVDENLLTDAQRTEFRLQRRIPQEHSWSAMEEPWVDRPAEDFAEVFAIMNVAVATGPMNTAYGPVRDPAAFERLLESAGVRLDSPPLARDWRFVARQEVAFAAYLLTDRWMRLAALGIFGFYAAYGARLAWRKAWRESQGPHAPHAIPS